MRPFFTRLFAPRPLSMPCSVFNMEAMPNEDTPRIGDLMVSEGLIRPEQLQSAIAEQQKRAEYHPLGQICLELSFLSRRELNELLQKHQKKLFLGELLMNMGLLTRAELEHMLQLQKVDQRRLGDLLIAHSVITAQQLVKALSIQLNIPRMIPRPALVDPALVEEMNIEHARSEVYFPLHRSEGNLTVVMADPLNKSTVSDLQTRFQTEIKAAIAPATEILQALEQLQSKPQLKNQTQSGSQAMQTQAAAEFLISSALLEGATAIHIEPDSGYLRVRYRQHGVLQHKTDLPADMLKGIVRHLCQLSGLELDQPFASAEISMAIQDQHINLQTVLARRSRGASLVIHLEPIQRRLFSLERLGMNPHTLKKLQHTLDLPGGLFLVAGPHSSGKRTALYACLDYLNDLDKNLISLEKRVLSEVQGVFQHEILPSMPISTQLDHLLSLTPDVLMLQELEQQLCGQIRNAAFEGCRILTSTPAPSLNGLLWRLQEWGLTHGALSATLNGVLLSRRVRTLCPNCRMQSPPSESLQGRMGLKLSEDDIFYAPAGCETCAYQGFMGTTGLYEFWEIDQLDKALLLEGQTPNIVRASSRQFQQQVTFIEDGIYKALQGITSLEEILRVIHVPLVAQGHLRSCDEIRRLCETRP